MLVFDGPNTDLASATEGLNAQLVIKIIEAPFYITNHSIRSHNTNNSYIRSWTFECSIDSLKSAKLHSAPQNEYLNNKSA